MKEEEIRNICTAAAGLYGIIHVRQLSEVLAYVGETNHTRRRLLGLLEESVPANCCLKEGFLYCDHVFERWADWERILERSARKPLCLLPLEELLPYADHEYIEWTPAAEELLSLFEGQGERAWLRQLLEQIALDMRRGESSAGSDEASAGGRSHRPGGRPATLWRLLCPLLSFDTPVHRPWIYAGRIEKCPFFRAETPLRKTGRSCQRCVMSAAVICNRSIRSPGAVSICRPIFPPLK